MTKLAFIMSGGATNNQGDPFVGALGGVFGRIASNPTVRGLVGKAIPALKNFGRKVIASASGGGGKMPGGAGAVAGGGRGGGIIGSIVGGAAGGAGAAAIERALAGRSTAVAGRRRRAKGITGTELRGFNRVAGLLRKVGMVPRKLGGRARVRKSCK